MQYIKEMLRVKDARIMAYLSAASFILLAVFALVALSLPAPMSQSNQIKAPNRVQVVDRLALETRYKTETVAIFHSYEQLASSTDTKPADIEKIKTKLLGLKVPTQFKDLHLNLVMAMVKMQSYLENGNQMDKELSLKALDEAKKNNAWLN